jgi:hypothetical protein
MIVYKIVRIEFGKYCSWYGENELRLTYEIGKPTYAIPELLKVGLGIFCFATLEAAISYDNQCLSKSKTILRCEGKVIPDRSRKMVLGYHTVQSILDYWDSPGYCAYIDKEVIMVEDCTPLEIVRFNREDL